MDGAGLRTGLISEMNERTASHRRSTRFDLLRVITLVAVLLSAAAGMRGQERSATVSGTVADPSGGFISGASVTMQARGRDDLRTNTGGQGGFRFDRVDP